MHLTPVAQFVVPGHGRVSAHGAGISRLVRGRCGVPVYLVRLRWPEGFRCPLAQELAGDIIVVTGSTVATAVQRETRTIPIAFVNPADPIATGITVLVLALPRTEKVPPAKGDELVSDHSERSQTSMAFHTAPQ
jgi:hypothetical protein